MTRAAQLSNSPSPQPSPGLLGEQANPGLGKITGPILIAITTLIMLAWSWETWPDPLVDFGAQLYVPWQLSTGHVLYRDVAYYNGPLSSYLNAVAFRIVGVGIHTLVGLNLLIMILTMVVAYRLTIRVSGMLSATMAGLTFALIFAFSQVVRLGNYNWLTPYTHEITHGTALGLAAIACIARYQRTDHARWIAAAGALLGAVFLTKAEPTAAAFLGVGVQLASGWWIVRTDRRRILSVLGLLVSCALAGPLIAWMLLSAAMPAHEALRGVLGSWPWVLDRRITALHFYREVAGLNDIPANLRVMLKWTIIYATLIGSAVGLGLLCQSKRSRVAMTVAAFVICSAMIAWNFSEKIVPGMLTPVPFCLMGALVITAIAVVRRANTNAALRLGLVIFATVLVAKMGLTPYAYHYGFVLAWPATTVLICAVTQDLPAWVDRRGGWGAVVRAVGLSAWITAVAAILYSDKINFDKKKFTIAAGTVDEFRGDGRAMQVEQVCDRINQWVPPSGTIVVLPQGLMINYLTRRAVPITSDINFMPPEVLAAGEEKILGDLNRHPPDAVVLTPAVIEDGHFTLDSRDPYGADTLKWVLQNYSLADPTERTRPLQILLRNR